MSRIHLRGVGHPDARFDPLDLDLTAGGAPCDTVLWLENGGGKTSLLSLAFSVLRPGSREFLGAQHKRALADYVTSGDVGHVVIEWHLPTDGLPGVGEDAVLITGMTLEWADLRAQRSNNAALHRNWWGFRAVGRYGLDALPFCDADGRPRRARQFAEQLARDLDKSPAAQLHRPDSNQRAWHEWLTHKELDPEVFRFQVAMNADEGAIAEEFAFPSGDAFVEWALRVAADPELPSTVAAALDRVQARIHQIPRLELERELCEGAVEHLGDLTAAHELITETTSQLTKARQRAADLARSIELAADAAQRTSDAEQERQSAAESAARQANTEARQAQRLANRWTQLAAAAALAEAEAKVVARQDAADGADLDQRAWAQTDHLAERSRLVGLRDALEEQLARFEEGLAPLKEQIAAAEARLAARVAHVTAEIQQQLDRIATDLERLDDEAAEDADTADRLRTQETTAQRQLAAAEATLAGADQLLKAAVGDGLLDDDTDPETAATAAADALAKAGKDLADALEQRNELESAEPQLVEQVAAARDERRDAETAAKRADERLQAMDAQAAALESDEHLVAATQTTPADVWSQPEVTLDRLHRFADNGRRAHIDARLQRAETDRIVEALEADGYAPPSPDVTAALRRLHEADIPAVAGYQYLADAVPAADRVEALDAVPDVAAGIVVTDPDRLDHAAAALDGLVPSMPVTLGTAAALLDPSGQADRRVVPPDPAVYDRAAAAELAARLEDDRRQVDAAIDKARRRVAEVEKTVAVYEALHRNWPDPQVVRDEAAAAEARLREEEGKLAQAQRRHTELRGRRDRARAAVAPLEAARDTAKDRQHRLATLAAAWQDRPAAATSQQEAADELERIGRIRADLAGRDEARREWREQLTSDRGQLQAERRAVVNTLRRVGLEPVGVASVDDPGGTLEALEQALTARRGELRRVRSEGGLVAQLDDVRGKLASVTATIGEETREVVDRAGQLLASPAGQDLLSRRQAAREAARRHDRCVEQLGEAKAAQKRAKQESDAAADLDVSDLPDGTVVPADAEARRRQASALTRRSNQLNEERTRHTNAARGHEQAAAAASQRAALLRTTLGHLAADVGDAAPSTDVTAFVGDDADEQVRSLRGRLASLTEQRQTAVGELQAAHHGLLRLVRSDRFASLLGDGQATSRIADRLTLDDAAAVAADAAELEEELRRRAVGIRKDLAEVHQHRQLLVDQLVGVARDAIGLLDDIQARSRMPEGLAGWSSRRFIEIRHEPLPDDPAALGDRISRVVDQLIEQQSTPDGHQLLYRVARAAVGDQPFLVRILKPHMDLRHDRVDITALAGFSGGQKVTAAIALFTTMLNMRATARGKHGYRTTLLLDNPFGKSSADAFVRLQRQVAERLGVQLVFTTAVKDLEALSQFRRVIRLEHRRNRHTAALHVVEKPRASLVGAAVTRGDAPVVDEDPAA